MVTHNGTEIAIAEDCLTIGSIAIHLNGPMERNAVYWAYGILAGLP